MKSIFKYILIFSLLLTYTCEEFEATRDNPIDPSNEEYEPPAWSRNAAETL